MRKKTILGIIFTSFLYIVALVSLTLNVVYMITDEDLFIHTALFTSSCATPLLLILAGIIFEIKRGKDHE